MKDHVLNPCTACMFNLFVLLVRRRPNMSGDHENIFHRSLDLLHFWITDCKRVDFTPMSSLVSTLENFLNAEVTTRASLLQKCPVNS